MAKIDPKKLPKGVDLLPSGMLRVRIYTDGRRHTIGTFHTKGDAEAALTIARGEIARGTFVPPAEEKAARRAAAEKQKLQQLTLDDVAQDWLQWLERVGRARGTVYTYRSRYRTHVAPLLGNLPIQSITPDVVDDWHSEVVDAKGDGVARAVYLALSALFSYAEGKAKGQPRSFRPLISENPCQVSGATKHRPKNEDVEKVATPVQVAGLAALMPESQQLAVHLAGWCALRIGEVLGLKRGDISNAGGQAWVSVSRQIQARGGGLYEAPPKSEAGSRALPIPSPIVPLLEDHLRRFVGKPKSALLFPRTVKADQWTHPNTLRNNFNRARDQWNLDHPEDALEGFTFHSLRHTALTRIGQAGATLEELKRYAGHSSAEVVAKYQHATRERLAMLSNSLDVLTGLNRHQGNVTG